MGALVKLVAQLAEGALALLERFAGEAAALLQPPQERAHAVGHRAERLIVDGNLAREVLEQGLGRIRARPAPEPAVW